MLLHIQRTELMKQQEICNKAGLRGTIGSIQNNTRKIPVPRSRNTYDVSWPYIVYHDMEDALRKEADILETYKTLMIQMCRHCTVIVM